MIIAIIKNKEIYRRLRTNARLSAIDVADVSIKWCDEVYRIRGKVFINKTSLMKEQDEETEKTEEDESKQTEIDIKYAGNPTDIVYISGTFDDWSGKEYRMSYNHLTKEFYIHLKVFPGIYYYTLKVNGKTTEGGKMIEVGEKGEISRGVDKARLMSY